MGTKHLLLCLALQLTCTGAEPTRKYFADTVERASRVPAIFDMSGTLLPHWHGQALVGVEANQSQAPLIYRIDEAGRRDQFSFTIPDAAILYVHGLAIGSGGTVAIAAGAVDSDSKVRSFLAVVPPDRNAQIVVETTPYVAWDVTFVPDGSLWTVGYTFDHARKRYVEPNVMAHFDGTGKLLTSFPVVAKARFGPGKPAALQHSFLRISDDRMGWFTNGLEYIEFSFDGRELTRYEGPHVKDPLETALWSSFALSPNNEVILASKHDEKRQTWQLDRDNARWIPVQFEDEGLPAWGRVLGFDGHTLVLTGTFHEFRRYRTNTIR